MFIIASSSSSIKQIQFSPFFSETLLIFFPFSIPDLTDRVEGRIPFFQDSFFQVSPELMMFFVYLIFLHVNHNIIIFTNNGQYHQKTCCCPRKRYPKVEIRVIGVIENFRSYLKN
uniref:Uncharacterized protein n=1 Tax=Cacopsylla melanoneura TaxID=428564 RepID=A0A8D8S2E8_9HEMI